MNTHTGRASDLELICDDLRELCWFQVSFDLIYLTFSSSGDQQLLCSMQCLSYSLSHLSRSHHQIIVAPCSARPLVSRVGCFGSIPFDSFEHLILLIPWTDYWTDSFDSGLSIQKLIKIDAGYMDLRTEICGKGHIAQINCNYSEMWVEICDFIICHTPAIIVSVLPSHFSDSNSNDDGNLNQGKIAWAIRASMPTLPVRKITVRSAKLA